MFIHQQCEITIVAEIRTENYRILLNTIYLKHRYGKTLADARVLIQLRFEFNKKYQIPIQECFGFSTS